MKHDQVFLLCHPQCFTSQLKVDASLQAIMYTKFQRDWMLGKFDHKFLPGNPAIKSNTLLNLDVLSALLIAFDASGKKVSMYQKARRIDNRYHGCVFATLCAKIFSSVDNHFSFYF